MQSGQYFPVWWIFLFTAKYVSIVTVSNCSNADVMDFSQPANESPHKCTLNSFTLLHRIIGTPGSADILLRLSKQTVHHPHAPAYALTPFSHTHLWPKRIRLSLVQRQSYSLASQVKEGGGGQFSQWDLNTELISWLGQQEHTSAFLYFAFPQYLVPCVP